MRLTQKTVNTLRLPIGKTEAIYFDEELPLGVRLRVGGAARWIYQYKLGAKHRRITLGALAALSAAEARKVAGELHARVRLGQDPAVQKAEGRARAAETMGAVLQTYLAYQQRRLRPRSYVEVERHLLKHCRQLHGLQLAKIDRRAIAARISAIATRNGAVAANRTRASLAAFFAWCLREGLVDSNPTIGTNRQPEQSRDRVLSPDEIKRIWNALDDNHYGVAVKLLLLTGQRATEIGSLRWTEVGDDEIVLPAARTKNRREHVVPLAPVAKALLKKMPRRGEFVFERRPGRPLKAWSTFKENLDDHIRASGAVLPPWCHHDLRRTAATGMAEIGVAPHVVEAVLNHVSGHKASIAGVYNKAVYAAEKRRALTIWAEYVLAPVEGRESKVVPLSGAATRS